MLQLRRSYSVGCELFMNDDSSGVKERLRFRYDPPVHTRDTDSGA